MGMLLTRRMLEDLRGSDALVIMHWDADAISTVAMVKKYLGLNTTLYTPPIGVYKVIYDDVPRDGYSLILDVDFGVSTEELERLGEWMGLDVYVIDHHRRMDSDKIFIADYMSNGRELPSASTTFLSLYNLEPDIFSAIGLAGDIHHRLENSVFRYFIDSVSKEYGLTWRDVVKVANLLDTNYISKDREGVYRAVDILMEHESRPEGLLEFEEWLGRWDEINRSIASEMERAEDLGEVLYLDVESPYLIASKVGRALSRRYPDKIVFITNRDMVDGYSQVYVRCMECDLTRLINMLVEMGFSAGGRRDVVGVIVDRKDYDRVVEHVKRFLGVDDVL